MRGREIGGRPVRSTRAAGHDHTSGPCWLLEGPDRCCAFFTVALTPRSTTDVLIRCSLPSLECVREMRGRTDA